MLCQKLFVMRGFLKLFLGTRGMTRLNLRSQVFENSNCFGSTKDLMEFENVSKQFRLHNFEPGNYLKSETIYLDLTNDLDLI